MISFTLCLVQNLASFVIFSGLRDMFSLRLDLLIQLSNVFNEMFISQMMFAMVTCFVYAIDV